MALLALAAPEKLGAGTKKAIERGPNQLSVISYWEVLLKAGKGKLTLAIQPYGGRWP